MHIDRRVDYFGGLTTTATTTTNMNYISFSTTLLHSVVRLFNSNPAVAAADKNRTRTLVATVRVSNGPVVVGRRRRKKLAVARSVLVLQQHKRYLYSKNVTITNFVHLFYYFVINHDSYKNCHCTSQITT